MTDAARYTESRLADDEDLQALYLESRLATWQWSLDNDPDNTTRYWEMAIEAADRYGLRQHMETLLGV